MPWGTLDESNLSNEEALSCLADVANSLAEMHKLHVSHGDVNLGNIMVVKQVGKPISCKHRDLDLSHVGSRPHALLVDVIGFARIVLETDRGGWLQAEGHK